MARLSYLASAYSDDDTTIVENRMSTFLSVDAKLMIVGKHTVSPLFKHFILGYGKLPSDWVYWREYSESLLRRCNELLVIDTPGWENSSGVRGEIDYAHRLGLPIFLINVEGVIVRSL